MEELLRELIAVNREMLNELRLLRQAMGREEPTFALHAPEGPSVAEPVRPAEHKSPPPRFTPEDLEDIHGSLLDGLKKRNRDKSNAFSEFEKRHKNW